MQLNPKSMQKNSPKPNKKTAIKAIIVRTFGVQVEFECALGIVLKSDTRPLHLQVVGSATASDILLYYKPCQMYPIPTLHTSTEIVLRCRFCKRSHKS